MNKITKKLFGTLPDGREVFAYTMRNASGMKVRIMDMGGTVLMIKTPDRFGRLTDVVCGYDSLADYMEAGGYLGALIGRWGNRIGKAAFTLEGKTYSLYKNDGNNHLHGGKVGFDHRIWSAEPVDGEEPKLILTLVSPDGEEGYPGTLCVKVTYTLTKDNALSIHYEAETDRTTVLNLTNHSYFNLGGYASGKVFDQELWMDADRYLRTDAELIPTGEIVPVAGTPFDFRSPKTIGRDFSLENPDMKLAGGYDHCFCFADNAIKAIAHRVTAYDPKSGREMKVFTDQPCVQLYTANFLNDENHPLKGGYPQGTQNAFCLETQHMPDSMNHPGFTDCVLRPGDKYDYTTIYQFSVR